MKYTLEQLQIKTNNELDELCALGQGYSKHLTGWMIKDNSILFAKDFSPTTNKVQAWDLMINYGCFPVLRNGIYLIRLASKLEVEHEDPQIAVTMAAILSAQENR